MKTSHVTSRVRTFSSARYACLARRHAVEALVARVTMRSEALELARDPARGHLSKWARDRAEISHA